MNEEMTNLEEMENVEIIELDEEPETSGGGILGKIVVGTVVAAVGVGAALLYKNKGKLDERRIKKLEKRGYVVYKTDDSDESEDVVDDDVDDAE